MKEVKIVTRQGKKYRVTSEELYTNSKGEYLWLFNWQDGGFNDMWAKTKTQAIQKVKKEFSLKANPDSFRMCTYEEYQEQNRAGWLASY
tara:strand:+ start:63 stop:329 length:267 start_codon:yes stop_codon:yes gene_type:complete